MVARKILLFIVLFCIGCGGTKSRFRNDASTFGRKAYAAFITGNLTNALVYYNKGAMLAGKLDNPLQKTHYLFNIGRVYFELEHYDSAEIFFSGAEGALLLLGDTLSASGAAGYVALCKLYQDDIPGAQTVFSTWAGRGIGERHFWTTIEARIARYAKQLDESERLLESIVLSGRKKKELFGLALNSYYRASIRCAKKDYHGAKVLLHEALQYLDISPEQFRRWKILLGLSTVEFCAGNSEKGAFYHARAQECAPVGVQIPALHTLSTCPDFF